MISRLILPANRHWASSYPHHCRATPTLATCFFSTTRRQYDDFINHYEILKVPENCSQAELKKQFYTLSRLTHPDVNKTDPDASIRFSQISESYSILADPERRKRYDRDVLRVHQQPFRSSAARSAGGAGAFGENHAGSRPASGLSKRRGTFRGPPPSFYAHGGRDSPRAHAAAGAGAGAGTSSTTGPGPDFHVPPNMDFDPQPIHRTQTQEDVRRQSRRAAALAAAQKEMEEDAGFWVRVVIVTGLLVGGVSVAGLLLGFGGSGSGKRGGLVRGDGSRRNTEGRNEWARS